MKGHTGKVLFLSCCLIVAFNVGLTQDKKDAPKPSEEEAMKRAMEAMTPGPQHKMLEDMAGTWDAEIKMWMKGPTGEPMVTTGTSEQKMVLGGRYLEEEVSSTMMNMPFNGVGYTGYDNVKKKYVSTWMDNMGTGIMSMEGTMDKDGKKMTMWGKVDDPSTGQKNKSMKTVMTIVDKDKHVFDYYDVTSYGDKKPVMIITYTRKKT